MIMQSADRFRAAARWKLPKETFRCYICTRYCAAPHGCARRGSPETCAIRAAASAAGGGATPALEDALRSLEQASREQPAPCCPCPQPACQECLSEAMLHKEACPRCRQAVWPDIFVSWREDVVRMMRSVVRFACDDDQCRDAEPFGTPEELAFHFRDKHQEDETKIFVAAVVLQDYQRLARRSTALHSQLRRSMSLLVRHMLGDRASSSRDSRSRSRTPPNVD
jgi:hypothetical protein